MILQSIPLFNSVVLLYAKEVDQVFFLQVDLFLEQFNKATWTRFLALSAPPEICSEPDAVRRNLIWIYDQFKSSDEGVYPETIVLSTLLSTPPEALISLAGVLLEYPIAYAPRPSPPSSPLTGSSYLSGETLDFFEVTLRSNANTETIEPSPRSASLSR